LRLALDSLASHKLRSGLTLLGIVIGVFTVVAMMALLNGLRKSIDKQLGELGANVFQIRRFPVVQFGEFSPEIQARKKLTLMHMRQLRDTLRRRSRSAAGMGVGQDRQRERQHRSRRAGGRRHAGVLHSQQSRHRKRPRVHRGGNELRRPGRRHRRGGHRLLVSRQEPIGKKIKLGRMELEVIGTIERQGGIPIDSNPDNTIGVPISLFMELYGTSRSVDIAVMAPDPVSVSKLQDQAVTAFRQLRGLDSSKENDFEIVSNESMRAMFDNLATGVTIASAFMCFLSLIVGGIA